MDEELRELLLKIVDRLKTIETILTIFLILTALELLAQGCNTLLTMSK